MRSFRTTGHILRLRDLGELDRFITIFTKEHGKITCIAKGIRQLKSRRNPHIELLSRIEAQLWKSAHHLYLTQAQSNERFKGIKEDMATLTSATFLAEMVDRLTADEQAHEALFELLEETFELMNFYPERHAFLREVGSVKILNLLGHLTSFRHCGRCRKTLPLKPAYLHAENLTLICETCHETEHQTHTVVSLEILKLLHFILEKPVLASLKLKWEAHHLSAVHDFGRLFLDQNLSYPLKSAAFLGHY